MKKQLHKGQRAKEMQLRESGELLILIIAYHSELPSSKIFFVFLSMKFKGEGQSDEIKNIFCCALSILFSR